MTTLRIEGDVEKPVEFSPEDLGKLPGQIPDISVQLAGREGSGVRLAALLEKAGVRPGASFVTLESSDGKFSACVPVEGVRNGIVVYRLQGEPLPAKKGGPFRFYLDSATDCEKHGADACANVKFLSRVTLSKTPGKDTRPKK